MRVTKNNICGVMLTYMTEPSLRGMFVVLYRDHAGHMQGKIYCNKNGKPLHMSRLPKTAQAWCDTHPHTVDMSHGWTTIRWD